jgi:hypothetical protein
MESLETDAEEHKICLDGICSHLLMRLRSSFWLQGIVCNALPGFDEIQMIAVKQNTPGR